MEFLVEADIRLPRDLDPAGRERLLDNESRYAAVMRRDGHLVRIWRVPGRSANVAIWDASDATILHLLLVGLPLFPYMSIDVRPLATHPVESRNLVQVAAHDDTSTTPVRVGAKDPA